MRKSLNCLFVCLVSFVWASVYFLGGIPAELTLKPFVYRALVPLLASWIHFMGVPVGLSTVIVMTLSGMGLYLSLRELYFSLYREGKYSELYLVLTVCGGMLLFESYRKPYDLMTAWLFTWCFLLILKRNDLGYLVVFILACINRETAFLLILVYMVSRLVELEFVKSLWIVACQIFIYLDIALMIRLIFRDLPSVVDKKFEIDWTRNFIAFLHNPYLFLFHVGIVLLVLWRIHKVWKFRPLLPKIVLFIFAPILTFAYVFGCQPFEIRMYWELYPAMGLLMIPKGT